MDDDIRVLLVDDQELFRAGVQVIVDAQEGMRVVGVAGDGHEAVRAVEELAPDVVPMASDARDGRRGSHPADLPPGRGGCRGPARPG